MAAASLSGSALAQSDADILLREGDALGGGWIAESILEHDLSDGGSWIALVESTEPATMPNKAVVVDGSVVLREGQTLPSGELVVRIRDVAMGPGGAAAIIYEVEDLTSANNAAYRMSIGSVVVLREEQMITVAGAPAGARIEVLTDVDIAFPYTLVAMNLSVPGQAFMTPALIRYNTPGLGAGSATLEAIGGTVPAGLGGPVNVVFGSCSVTPDGSFAAALGVDVGGTTNDAGLRRTGGFGEEGTGTGIFGSTWRHVLFPQVAAANGDARAISSQIVVTGTGVFRGRVNGSSGVLAREGGILPGPAGGLVGNFIRADVAMTVDGRTAFGVPLESGRDVLLLEQQQVLRTNVSMAGNFLITDLPYSLPEFVQVNSNGSVLDCIAELGLGGEALIRVERSIGNTISCSAVPNSTGATGKIAAFGSTNIAFNSLEVIASDLPLDAFGYLGCSTTPGFAANPGGSSGNLCLGGAVGRFVDQVQSSGSTGRVTTIVDLDEIPQPTGAVAAMAGDVWGFQFWHRDTDGTGGATSNFSELVTVTLQ